MSQQNTFARSLNDVGLAAWFGGGLMGAVGLNAASRQVADPADRSRVANAGWARWTPVNLLAITAHLVGAVQLTRANKGRMLAQRGVGTVTAAKAAATGAALAATAYSRVLGQRIIDAEQRHASSPIGENGLPVTDATTPAAGTDAGAASAQRQLTVLQWLLPALTGGVLVLNAKAGEQQRPAAVVSGVAARVRGVGKVAATAAGLGATAVAVGKLLRSRSARVPAPTRSARQMMTGGVECVGESESLTDAARKMAQHRVGALPICGDDERLKGMLTDRDIVVKAVAEGRGADTTTAGELAQGKPVTIGADDSVSEALATMARAQVRRLPVIDGHRLIGVVSLADVARNIDRSQVGELVRSISLER